MEALIFAVGLRMVGANAIVGLRYDASEIGSKGSATEVLCYGTAVVVEEAAPPPDHT